MPSKKRKKQAPTAKNTFYEIAWRARRDFIFPKAAKEGRGDLYRTLKIFSRIDRQYKLAVVSDYTDEGTKFHTGESKFIPIEKQKRSFRDIFAAGKHAIENDKIHATFEALDYSALPIQWLCEIAQERFDAIIELGAGYGRALFEVYFQGGPSRARYIGAEFTGSGRGLMAEFLKLEPDLPFETAFFDHNKPDFSFLGKKVERALIFTHHSIEQIKTLPEDYFSVLAAAAPHVVGVHFEPFGFQLVPESGISKGHATFIAGQNFNSNFLSVLKAAEEQKVLNIWLLAANMINPQHDNPTSVAVWERP